MSNNRGQSSPLPGSSSTTTTAGPSEGSSSSSKPNSKTGLRHSGVDLNAPMEFQKPSVATEMMIRMMRQSAKRLNEECKELQSVEDLIKEAMKDCEKEMELQGRMLDIAKRSLDFQKTGVDLEPDEDVQGESGPEIDVDMDAATDDNLHPQGQDKGIDIDLESVLRDWKEEPLDLD